MMRIAYLAPGAGELHCGACASDLGLVKALRRAGVAAHLTPLYTPLREGEGVMSAPVFMGGVALWLREKLGPLAPLVRPLRPLLDSAPLIRAASRFAVQTDPHSLGPLTVSVLRGSRGRHAAEVQRVVDFMAVEVRPAVVHLSNTLLSGFAPLLRQRLRCPIVCNVQGEEHFLTALPGRYRELALMQLRENLRHVDLLIRPTATNAETVGRLLGRGPESFAVVPPALQVDRLPQPLRSLTGITIAYLSAIRPEKGLDLLLAALEAILPRLASPVELRIAGQVADMGYWRRVRRRLPQLMPGISARFLGELTPAQKAAMLTECHLLVLPSRLPECRAMAALEAMAAGCAVIGPRHGIFTELLADSPNMLFDPGDVRSLGDTLVRALRDPPAIAAAAQRAATTALHYSADTAAQKLKGLYAQLLATGAQRPPLP
jgi:glycosyltransferase involved in cell wall biosynthesis